MQADGRCDLEYNFNSADRSDMYEFAGQAFGPPLTTWYTGDETAVRITLAGIDSIPTYRADTASLVIQTCNCESHGTLTFEQVAAVAFTNAHSSHSPTCAYADADVDCDGAVNIFDAVAIAQGLPFCEPCGGA